MPYLLAVAFGPCKPVMGQCLAVALLPCVGVEVSDAFARETAHGLLVGGVGGEAVDLKRVRVALGECRLVLFPVGMQFESVCDDAEDENESTKKIEKMENGGRVHWVAFPYGWPFLPHVRDYASRFPQSHAGRMGCTYRNTPGRSPPGSYGNGSEACVPPRLFGDTVTMEHALLIHRPTRPADKECGAHTLIGHGAVGA